jgi:ribonuclease D
MSAVILLDSILQKMKAKYPTNLSDDDLFEFYCTDNILINYDLDYTEIGNGIVDGPRDAGIDAAYVFINRQLLTEDIKLDTFKQPVDIELYIIQVKNQDSFKESAVDKLSSSLPLLLDPNIDKSGLEALFKPKVVVIFHSFFNVMNQLAEEFPKVAIRVLYCTKSVVPNKTVKAKAASLENTLRSKFTNVTFTFLGSQQLYERSANQKRLVKDLPTTGTPLSGVNSYVALCKLADYMKFITDDSGNLITRIFEANVRAYQGEVEVNREIAGSLAHPTPNLDFWWLNNGITIVADQAQFMNNRLTIENPLIVNGLQTSHEIHNYASQLPTNDQRMVLVRVIVENDRAKRDEIIRATNRQTSIKHSSFRATEPIHRQIEDYLTTLGYFYDRRKNFYKREGKPVDKIISIDRLAQGMLSVLLQKPHTARARPTSAIKDENDYKRIFSADQDSHPLEMYGRIAQMLDHVEAYFRSIADQVDQVYRNNMKFHVLMVLGWALNGNSTLPAKRIIQLDLSKITDIQVKVVADWVFQEFEAAGHKDHMAKDASFTVRLKANWTAANTVPPVLTPTSTIKDT